MFITKNFDSENSIDVALDSIERELNSQGLFPTGVPKLLIEGKQHKVFWDNDGNPVSAYYGVVTQSVRAREKEERGLEFHYVLQPFGIFSVGNDPIQWALEKVEKEISYKKGIPIGEIQIMNQYESKSNDWTTFGGILVQLYYINPLLNSFK